MTGDRLHGAATLQPPESAADNVDAGGMGAERPRASGRGLGGRSKSARFVRGVVGVVCFIALCQVVTLMRPVSEQYLPDATTILAALVELLGEDVLWTKLYETLQVWAAGMAIAIAFAVPVGVVLGSSQILYRMFRGPLELLRPIPGIALFPLFILVFGQSFQATMWLVVYTSVWPILLNTVYGVHDVPATARDTARAFGLGRLATTARVDLPSALPLILTGVRVSASIALIVAVAVELFIGTGSGIGAFINELVLGGQERKFIYAAAVAAGLLGLALNLILRLAEDRICPWRAIRRGETP